MIKVPTPFQYTSDKAVPWNYANQVISQGPQVVRVSPEEKQDSSVNDIVDTGGLTRSGRYYAPCPSGVKEGEEDTEQSGIKATILKKKGKQLLNESIIDIEANEFLKFIKYSEYNIVEWLHKLSTKIFLLALMLYFGPHREAILKVLKQVMTSGLHVPHNTPIDKIDRLVGNIMMDNYISFSDDKIPPNGRGST